jgi:hypothetical protein
MIALGDVKDEVKPKDNKGISPLIIGTIIVAGIILITQADGEGNIIN